MARFRCRCCFGNFPRFNVDSESVCHRHRTARACVSPNLSLIESIRIPCNTRDKTGGQEAAFRRRKSGHVGNPAKDLSLTHGVPH